MSGVGGAGAGAGGGAGAGAGGGGGSEPEETNEPLLAFLYAAPLVGTVGNAIDNLGHEGEQHLIRETLRNSWRRICYSCRVATQTNFLQMINAKRGCRVLHYSGHGLPSGLVFESDTGQTELVSGKKLTALVKSAAGSAISLAFVSACYSQPIGEAFVMAGVPHVVAVRWDAKIPDNVCQIFERGFYTVLFEGGTVAQAFKSAEAYAGVDPEHFLLLPRGDHHHQVPIFADAMPGPYRDVSPPTPINTCDAVPSYFMGRNAEVQQVVQRFWEHNRCVTVQGDFGIGKTCVALRAAEYMNDRSFFRGGIYMISMGGNAIRAATAAAAASPVPSKSTTAAAKPFFQCVADAVTLVDHTGPPRPLDVRSEQELAERLSEVSERMLLVLDDCPGAGGSRSPSVTDNASSMKKGYPSATPLANNAAAAAAAGTAAGTTVGAGGSPAADAESTDIQSFVSLLLRRTPKTLHLLITTDSSFGGGRLFEAEKVVSVGPLPHEVSAMLFASLFPRQLMLHEMGATTCENAISEFAATDLIQGLEGNPRAIALATAQLKEADLTRVDRSTVAAILEEAKSHHPGNTRGMSFSHMLNDLPPEPPALEPSLSSESTTDPELLAQRRHLLDIELSSTLPDVHARRLWMSMGPVERVSWDQFRSGIVDHFHERVPEAASLRPLTASDLDKLHAKCIAVSGCDFVTTPLDVSGFAKFWKLWLGPVFELITRLHRLWGFTEPRILQGFIDKTTASAMLVPAMAAGRAGAFLLRFSDRHPGWLAVAYVFADPAIPALDGHHLSIRHTLIRPSDDGFDISFVSRVCMRYPSLLELLKDVELTTLFPPGIPVETAFASISSSAPYHAMPVMGSMATAAAAMDAVAISAGASPVSAVITATTTTTTMAGGATPYTPPRQDNDP